MLNTNNTLRYGDVEMMSTYPVSRPTFLLTKCGDIERVDAFLVVYSRIFEGYEEPFETYPIGERGFIHFECPVRNGEALCFHGPISRKDPFYKELRETAFNAVEFADEADFISECKNMGLEIID